MIRPHVSNRFDWIGSEAGTFDVCLVATDTTAGCTSSSTTVGCLVRSLMAIGTQQAAIRAVIATLAEHVSESGRSVNALIAMRQAEAIVKALELAGYEIKRRT
jgi:hypothetical protein